MIWVSSFLNIKPQTLILWGAAIILLLIISALALIIWSVPDPRVFNENIEKVFLENDFSTQTEIKLLEVLASSGSLFESSISLYSSIIFTLVIITISMMVISFGSLMSNIHLRQQFVALKNSVWRVKGVRLKIRSISGINPISSMRSASSTTIICTPVSNSLPRSK